MNGKEYLNEEQMQRTKKKINLIGKILLIVGGLSFVTCAVLTFGKFDIDIELKGLLGFGMVFSFAFVGFGMMALFVGHQREITAFMAQQQMPVAKEGIEKMAPTAGVAAKEISKGVVEGIEEAKSKKED